jgi:hypothetical protein
MCNVYVDQDAWLKQASPDENHGDDTELSCKNTPGDLMRPVYRFALPNPPANINVVSATAWFYVTSRDDSGSAVNVHRITAPWSENSVTWWDLADEWDGIVEGAFYPASEETWVGVDLSSLVAAWSNGAYPNDGLTLMSTSAGIESQYSSREWNPPSQRPCLHVVTTCDSSP